MQQNFLKRPIKDERILQAPENYLCCTSFPFTILLYKKSSHNIKKVEYKVKSCFILNI